MAAENDPALDAYGFEGLSEADLQAITMASAGMWDFEDILQVLADLKRRVARVEIDGHPQGTGVLVQPDVLLTAGHVMGSLDKPGLLNGNMWARFDYHRTAPPGPYGEGTPVQLVELMDYSPMSQAELGRSPLAWDAPPDCLDYALLRAATPVPPCEEGSGFVPRGHYTLDSSPYDVRRAPLLFLAHHAVGKRLQLAAPVKPVLSPGGTRVRYERTNTLKGSSGGPIVDARGRLVALHTYTSGNQNQGVPITVIGEAVRQGPSPWVADPTAPGGIRTRPPTIMLSWAEEDRNWASRVYEILSAAGHRVLMGPVTDGPGPRTIREHVEAGGKTVAIVSPAYLASPEKTSERDFIVYDLDPATARHRLLPLLVAGEVGGSLALLSPVDLRATGDADVEDMLVAAVTGAGPARTDAPASAPDTVLTFSPDDPLPRLQRYSERARRSAGNVSSTNFADGLETQFETGLYITRDQEQKILASLATDRGTPVVVTGEAGCGKTSLLWGLARRYCEAPAAEIFFLKATWLAAEEDGTKRVDQKLLLDAIAQAHRSGRTVTVLIDTVDVLVNNTASWDSLVTIVESAVRADAAVVVSSRVQEAEELPSRWQRHRLSDYAHAPDPDATFTVQSSEFERAVLAHSKCFTKTPRVREDVITRMLEIAARDISVKALCLRPLTLRMLFEIYTPGAVPDIVDTTGLYETYWNHRVVSDRRYWDGGGEPRSPDHDLSHTAMLLALEMLRTGKPEAHLGRVRLPAGMSSGRFTEDVILLVARGVGQSEHGVFQFFHQTFFEYAASRALVQEPGGAGLRALVKHVHGQENDDYFLLAVLEQAWLCADRISDCAHVAEETVGDLLRIFASAPGDEPTAPRYGLRRAVLSVCAQSSLLTAGTLPVLLDLLRNDERLPLPALNQFLTLLPAPARAYGADDIAVLRAAFQRRDLAWITVLEVLSRLLPRDSEQVFTTLEKLQLISRATAWQDPLASRGELADFLVTLLYWAPETASSLLVEVAEAALDRSGFDYVGGLLTRMAAAAADHEDPERWARCADRMLAGRTVTSAALIKAHTAAVLPYLRGLNQTELVDLATALVPRLLSSKATTVDRSRLGALLTALAQADQSPDTDPSVVVDLLTQVTRHAYVTDLAHGAMVRLLGCDTPVGDAVRDMAVRWLVDAMPVSTTESLADIRFKVVMQALEQLDLPLSRVADVAGRAAHAWSRHADSPTQVWQDRRCLRDLVVRGAAADIPEAMSVLAAPSTEFEVIGKDVVTWLSPFLKRTPAEHEAGLLADLLLRIGKQQKLEELLKYKVSLDAATRARLVQTTLAAVRETVPEALTLTMSQETRGRLRSLASLLVLLEQADTTVPLAWDELKGWIDRVPDSTTVGWLVELVGGGLRRKVYPPPDALRVLRRLCGADRAAAIDCTSEQGRRARRWCVWWYAVHGTAADVEEACRLGFVAPVDASAIAELSAYVIGDDRSSPLTGESAVDLLLGVGHRLKQSGLGDARRKNVARAWQAAMRIVVPAGDASTHLRIVRQLPRMEDYFAAQLLQYVPLRRATGLRSAVETMTEEHRLGDRLQNAVDRILDRYKRGASDGGWPQLLKDLRR
ncbi:TIR domain-containing protein [Streptomyces sp. WSLK1-5]|uniref:TIR domain-containing protein n=1 Tax=unclassified Streptomyces TaxID=2593676 RepID=UPI00378E9D29